MMNKMRLKFVGKSTKKKEIESQIRGRGLGCCNFPGIERVMKLKFIASQDIAFGIWAEVQGPAEALLELLAMGAGTALHPAPVAHGLEFVVPDVQEVVVVDVALYVGAVHVGAGADVAVYQDAADVDAGAAEEVAVTDIFLVFARIGLATE